MKLSGVNINDTALKCFGRTVVLECEKFYADPENIKRFEEWKAKRDAAAAGKGESA